MADLLSRVRGEIDARMRELEGPVAEIPRLEAALAALGSSTADGTGGRRKAGARPSTSRARRRARRAPRGANRRAILKVIEARPDVSTSELASRTGIAKPTLYTTLAALVKSGVVEKRDVGGVSGYHLTSGAPPS